MKPIDRRLIISATILVIAAAALAADIQLAWDMPEVTVQNISIYELSRTNVWQYAGSVPGLINVFTVRGATNGMHVFSAVAENPIASDRSNIVTAFVHQVTTTLEQGLLTNWAAFARMTNDWVSTNQAFATRARLSIR